MVEFSRAQAIFDSSARSCALTCLHCASIAACYRSRMKTPASRLQGIKEKLRLIGTLLEEVQREYRVLLRAVDGPAGFVLSHKDKSNRLTLEGRRLFRELLQGGVDHSSISRELGITRAAVRRHAKSMIEHPDRYR